MPTDIVLKNKNGEDVTYENIETVTFDTPTEDVQAVFTYGQAVSGVELIPNFADGDQVIAETEGVLVKSGVIKKPATLLPENIKSGIEVAGVTGNFIGNALENIPIELDLAEGNQTINAPDGYLVKSAIIQKPETLVPENIAKGIEIAGVKGTMVGGGLSDDEYLKYFTYTINVAEETITLKSILMDLIYAEKGDYEVTIPNTISGLNVVVDLG